MSPDDSNLRAAGLPVGRAALAIVSNQALVMALVEAFNMTWEVLWPLILGFTLSGAVQGVVSHRSMSRLLGDDSPRSLTFATLFGIASSSCSYAAVALARSILLKGANFTAAMVFELASTNLAIDWASSWWC